MSFGEHEALVREVIDFPNSGRLLSSGAGSIAGVGVVRDFDYASRLAWSETYGAEEFLWVDIREREASLVKSGRYWAPSFQVIVDEIDQAVPQLTNSISKSLRSRYESIIDDVVSDLNMCAINRALNGKVDSFFERMFAVYSAGGWPCGWDGKYPSGTMVSFIPKRSC